MKLHKSARLLKATFELAVHGLLDGLNVLQDEVLTGYEEQQGYCFATIRVPYACCLTRLGGSVGISQSDIEKQETTKQLEALILAKLEVFRMTLVDECESHAKEHHAKASGF